MKTKHYIGISCTAALLTMGMTMTSFAAAGWQQRGDTWYYHDSYDRPVTESWKKSGNSMFYLGNDGQMKKSSLIEDNDNYYYVNSAGAMVSNEWRYLENPDSDDDMEYCWYYFLSNGKAAKNSSSGGVSFKSIKIASGETKKYAFDDQGRMMYGWISEDGERLTEEDAWEQGLYYCGNEADGSLVINDWRELETETSSNTDPDFNGTNWFYFGGSGKKNKDTTKTINNGKYRFDENGAAEFKWYEHAPAVASSSDASTLYYNLPEQCWLARGWFKTVPSEEVDSEAYSDDTEYWFYAKTNGELISSQIKYINGQYYGFNDKGEMLNGLYKITFKDDKIDTFEEIETEYDLPGIDDDCHVFYFGNSPKEGAMKTGSTTINIDGEKFSYEFRTSGGILKGAGQDGVIKDSIYIKGRKLTASNDLKYEAIEYKDNTYLVNTSGKIQKNKKNVKDSDGMYYCTDKNGIVTYYNYEK